MAHPWETEPTEATFEEAGLRCLMLRGPMGAWCGYVAVPAGHPLFGKGYDAEIANPPDALLSRPLDVDKVGAINVFCAMASDKPLAEACSLSLLIDVHGGLTYADDAAPRRDADGMWWFGFDCAHAGDLSPRMFERYGDNGIYRDMAYAERETRSLARQLAAWPSDAKEAA